MRPEPKAFSPRQREFWDQLRDFIHRSGGWVVSEPHTASIRFECRPESDLPELLRARGYDVVGAGTGERLLPSAQNVVPTVVEIHEFKLPFD